MKGFIRRTGWFCLDSIAILASTYLILGYGRFGGRLLPDNTLLLKQVGVMFGISLFSFWTLSAFYISFNRPQVSLGHDIKGLFTGSAITAVAISGFFIMFASWRSSFQWGLLAVVVNLALLGLLRTVEWKLVRRHHRFLALFVGLEDYWWEGMAEVRQQLPVNWLLATAFMPGPPPETVSAAVDSLTQDQISNFTAFCRKRRLLPLLLIDNKVPINDTVTEFIRECFGAGLPLISTTRFYEAVTGKVVLFKQNGRWITQSEFTPIAFWRLFFKRCFELILSSILLIPCLPVIMILVILIRFESPGPAFFIQERLGRHRRVFKMIKLRTMRTHTDDSSHWPHVADDFITPLGKILRKTGLDELPQLFNIIMGQMSFVGPRPARVLVSKRHAEHNPFFALTYPMAPGITGWAQIHQGRDTGDDSLLEKIRYNLYYIKHFSIFFDLRVILRTLKMLVQGKKPKRFSTTPSA